MSDRPYRDSEPIRRDVTIVGAGYVGLTTAACLARLGHEITCVDVDAEKIRRLAEGRPIIVEEGLSELLTEGRASGRLRFTTKVMDGAPVADFVFLCVPTPPRPDGSADVSALEEACLSLRALLKPGAVVVNKSTVPIGSAVLVERILGRDDVHVVSNPEFLREGTAVQDSLAPSRIVFGGSKPAVARRVADLYTGIDAPVLITDAATAEMIKYASNAFLATKLSFVNATARICEALGANIEDTLKGIGIDPRIGFSYLAPGPGWGGSCLPKDTRALAFMAREAGVTFRLLEEAISSNEDQIASVVDKVRRAVGGSLAAARIAAWGLTFKAGTDDRRNSPAIQIIGRLVAEGSIVSAYDPTTAGREVPELEKADLASDPYSACDGAEALVVLTEWEEFRSIDMEKLRGVMAKPYIVDARNLLDPESVRALGFFYVGIGR